MSAGPPASAWGTAHRARDCAPVYSLRRPARMRYFPCKDAGHADTHAPEHSSAWSGARTRRATQRWALATPPPPSTPWTGSPTTASPARWAVGSAICGTKIKHGIAKVTRFVISVGESIYCGIQYVVNGVTHVLRQVVHDLEDLAAMIGVFFVALGKLIEDVIELLSLLLQFEQVIKTHSILKAAIQGQIANLGTIANSVIPALNTFFGQGEGVIAQAFCRMKQLLVPGFTCGDPPGTSSPLVSGLSGSGASAHTIFSAAPKNGGGARTHAWCSPPGGSTRSAPTSSKARPPGRPRPQAIRARTPCWPSSTASPGA